MKYFYIGPTPPPYGGVTIKNLLLFEELKKNMQIEHVNFGFDKNKVFKNTHRFIYAILSKNNVLVIGIGSNKALNLFNKVFIFLNKNAMKRSVLIMMGGTAANFFTLKINRKQEIKHYSHIYVETNGMKNILNKAGVNNVSLFPNCRHKPLLQITEKSNVTQLKCLYFSQISYEKGADIAVEALKKLMKSNISIKIDFYGHISDDYKNQFNDDISATENINYLGVFKSDKDNVYEKLNEYDVLLFPTRWKHEGVPGVLVEAKISGLPAIVSDINFNSEIIEDGKSGIVINNNTSDELADAIERLYLDRNLLIKMKQNAKDSSESYFIENYIGDIIKMIIK